MNRIHKACNIFAANSIWSSILAFCMIGLPILVVCTIRILGMSIDAKSLGVLVVIGMPVGLIFGVIIVTTTGLYTKAYNHSRSLLSGDEIDISADKLIQDDISRSEEIICEACGKGSPKDFEICWSCQADLPRANCVSK